MLSDLKNILKDKQFLSDKEEIISKLSSLLNDSIKPHIKKERVGIAFSGGIDSTILAYLYSKQSKNYMLYAVGLEGSKDLPRAALVASAMKLPLKIKIISRSEAILILEDVMTALTEAGLNPTPMDVGIASVIYSVMLMAQKDHIKEILYGICMDEPFAGYDHHTSRKENYQKEYIQEQLWNSLHNLESNELSRDQAIARFADMKLTSPFMNEDLVSYAMQIDPSLKVSKTEKKIILREAACLLGIPKNIAYNKKTAAQYGSGFNELIKELAKKNGYPKAIDYLSSLIK